MKHLRILLWALVAAGLLALGALLLIDRANPPPRTATSARPVDFGGPFVLTGADGRRFSSSRLAGKPFAIFFGFTHCPDVCPTTLARLVRLRREATGGDDAMAILFVTVDPERDGPAEVGRYATLFDAPVVGLTGSPAEIARIKKEFGIHSEKVPGDDGDYSVDHSAAALLFDRSGKFVATVAPEEPDSAALAKIGRVAD